MIQAHHRGGECKSLVVRAALGGVVLDDLHGNGVVAMGLDAGHGDAGVRLGDLEHGEEEEDRLEQFNFAGVRLEVTCGEWLMEVKVREFEGGLEVGGGRRGSNNRV